MKIKILPVLFATLISLASVIALVPMNNVNSNGMNNWMSKVDDNTLIRDLRIPGTHDSGATHSIADVAGKCQDLSIQQQLDIGVRFFDIRLQMVNNEFRLVHDFLDQKLSFASVVNDFVSFIKENDSEFLIVSIKKDYDTINSTFDFEELLTSYLEPHKDVFSYDRIIPSYVKEARGKIYILDRYGMSIGQEASYWSDNTVFETDTLYVQDYYCIDKVEHKIELINDTFANSLTNTDKLFINFSSCYIEDSFPPLYAGTPALIINNYLKNYFSNNGDFNGVIVLDYASSELVSLICGGNYVE